MNTSLDPGPICLDANHPCVLPTVFFFFLPSPLKKKKTKEKSFFRYFTNFIRTNL
jgi:hypothetical protein